ncbi:hypothetical protein KFL_005180020 [Klebsormidium nitens]|uniref:Thiol-disulphide oxidoreductase DCC n=1 Tax=Klebsormidium nitens TaxID=105231 RepID=A0A1Y1IH63_KLENI|nr:hypothetical protein KFL_005180020 [Klebsormidium nitens]|eukprot:GAQ89402.1 hypothetical protein KFL_005180020 [Klebsormidium nitens]
MALSTSLVRTGAILSKLSSTRHPDAESLPKAADLTFQGSWTKPALQRQTLAPRVSLAQNQVTQLPEPVTPTRGPAHRSTRDSSSKGSASDQETAEARPGDELFATDKRPIVLFDGICNMCNEGVNFMLDNDPKGKLRYAALQSEAGRTLLIRSGLRPDDHSSMVMVYSNRAYTHSDAILHIAQCLQSPVYKGLGSFGLCVPEFARDAVYSVIAANRHKFMGVRDTCRFLDEEAMERFVS